MVGRGKQPSRMSYTGRDPVLSRGTPDSLRYTRPVHTPFDHARCPYISRQMKDRNKTEAQRRGESERGSLMVKLHRPFPELRPKHEQGQVRSTFNQAWFREQRAAQLKLLKAQRQVVQHENRRSEPVRER
ncbi:MAG: hypothetical protein JAY67_19495 [Candidatus Thiodiazotropha taylori]|nr:hypothetical protein [Candidatus Thiodiazotropha taylori]